jgi:hypothetical protein
LGIAFLALIGAGRCADEREWVPELLKAQPAGFCVAAGAILRLLRELLENRLGFRFNSFMRNPIVAALDVPTGEAALELATKLDALATHSTL